MSNSSFVDSSSTDVEEFTRLCLTAAERHWGSRDYVLRQTFRTNNSWNEIRLASAPETHSGGSGATSRVDLILNLPQDLEILKPIFGCIQLFSSAGAKLRLLITSKAKSFRTALDSLNLDSTIEILELPRESADRHRLLIDDQETQVLVSASESSAGAHQIVHNLFLEVPRSVHKITLQHGWECLGFLNHAQQDEQFGFNLKSAADSVLTWFSSGEMKSVFYNRDPRTVPIGVCKQVFAAGLWSHQPRVLHRTGAPRVLLADNRNSPRFQGTSEVSLWKLFVSEISDDDRFMTNSREHQRKGGEDLSNDTTRSLADIDFVISPPSTILIDAVAQGCVPVIFSSGRLPMNCANFGPIRAVSSLAEFEALITGVDMADYFGQTMRWLLDSVHSIRGDILAARYIISQINHARFRDLDQHDL